MSGKITGTIPNANPVKNGQYLGQQDVFWEMTATGGRAYIKQGDTEIDLTTKTAIVNGQRVLQFTADAPLTVNKQIVPADGKPDAIVVKATFSDNPDISDYYRVEQYYFSGTDQFEAVANSTTQTKDAVAALKNDPNALVRQYLEADIDGSGKPYADFASAAAAKKFAAISPENPKGIQEIAPNPEDNRIRLGVCVDSGRVKGK